MDVSLSLVPLAQVSTGEQSNSSTRLGWLQTPLC